MLSALLADAWGPGTEIRGAEPIWGRKHVMRLRVTTDRSVVLKRRGEREGGFGAELAALEYLNAMHDELCARWPETVIAAYPALAGPGSARVEVPEWWQPDL